MVRSFDDEHTARAYLLEQLEDRLTDHLTRLSILPKRQLRIACGIIDVLTDNTIYELKSVLTNSVLLGGVGQLLIYNQALPRRNLVLVSQTSIASKECLEMASNLGILVVALGTATSLDFVTRLEAPGW